MFRSTVKSKEDFGFVEGRVNPESLKGELEKTNRGTIYDRRLREIQEGRKEKELLFRKLRLHK